MYEALNTPYRRANPPYCQLLTVNLHVTLCVCVCVCVCGCVCEQYSACVTLRSEAAAFVYVNLECPTVVHAIQYMCECRTRVCLTGTPTGQGSGALRGQPHTESGPAPFHPLRDLAPTYFLTLGCHEIWEP